MVESRQIQGVLMVNDEPELKNKHQKKSRKNEAKLSTMQDADGQTTIRDANDYI
jgi:hypothetical protein